MGALECDTRKDVSTDFATLASGTPSPTSGAAPAPDADAELPYSPFSPLRKVSIIAIITAIAISSPLALDMYYPSLFDIRDDLGTTQSGITWTVTAYLMTMAVGPLVWSNLADYVGRKPVFMAAMAVYIAGSVWCALSRSLPELVVARVLQACGASVGQGSSAGVVTDIYPRDQRGTALGFYYMGILVGPNIGPLVGGLISEHAGWRWVFWANVIFGGVLFIAVAAMFPETHRRIVAKKHRIQPINIPPKLGIRDNNPLQDLATVRYPVVAIAMLNSAIMYGTNIVNATMQPQVYESVYALSQGTTGICMLSSGAGLVLGALCGGRIADLLIRRHRKKLLADAGHGEQAKVAGVPAETRMRAMWAGGVLFLCGFAAWGWLVEYKVYLAAVLVVQFFIGFGLIFTFQSVGTYLIDLFPERSARIFSAQNFWRGVFGAVMVQVLPTMRSNIGLGWTYMTMFFLALFALLSNQGIASKGVWLRKKFGPHTAF
ncbi:hypothetical protein H4R19_003335, partial [Coemansia spiralis]